MTQWGQGRGGGRTVEAAGVSRPKGWWCGMGRQDLETSLSIWARLEGNEDCRRHAFLPP